MVKGEEGKRDMNIVYNEGEKGDELLSFGVSLWRFKSFFLKIKR